QQVPWRSVVGQANLKNLPLTSLLGVHLPDFPLLRKGLPLGGRDQYCSEYSSLVMKPEIHFEARILFDWSAPRKKCPRWWLLNQQAGRDFPIFPHPQEVC